MRSVSGVAQFLVTQSSRQPFTTVCSSVASLFSPKNYVQDRTLHIRMGIVNVYYLTETRRCLQIRSVKDADIGEKSCFVDLDSGSVGYHEPGEAIYRNFLRCADSG